MLKLEKISKAYNARGVVLDNIDLLIPDGDSVAITGPSGSGKTTLMNIIGTLDSPDSGRVIFNESDVSALDREASARYRNQMIGFVFQDNLLMPHLTIFENIMLPVYANPKSGLPPDEKEAFAAELMSSVGITGIRDKYPVQVSGGEAQRATLVRALIMKPSMLLADEPTGSLDNRNSEILGSLLSKVNKELGITLIIATHSMKLAQGMNRKFILEEGSLKEQK